MLRATFVALSLLALGAQQLVASADDLTDALKRKQDLERAIQVSRANTERYKAAADQFQAAAAAAAARIADLAGRQAAAQNEVDALGFKIQIAEEQLALVSFQLTETQAFMSSLIAQSAEQARQLARREELYGTHLRTTYRQAQVSPLEMLLSAGSLADFASRVQAMVIVNRQDAQLAGEIRSLRADTVKKHELAAEKQKEIVGLQEQVTAQRAALAREKAAYEAAVRQAQALIVAQAGARQSAVQNSASAQQNASRSVAETQELQRKLQQAEALYVELAAAAARRSGLGTFAGSALTNWPISGSLTSGFGARWGGWHNGIDVAAPRFTPVMAAAAGTVVTVGKPYLASGDTATVVIIAHGSDFSTLYGHLDDGRAPTVSVGQRVAAGHVIGFIGMTGWTTGPHLHFMTIRDGRAVDPLPYLRR